MRNQIIVKLGVAFWIIFICVNNSKAQVASEIDVDHEFPSMASTLEVPEYNIWDNYYDFVHSNLLKTDPLPTWSNIGPNSLDSLSGRVACMSIDPQNSDKLYLGAASGGLWKSENGGDNWEPLMDEFPSMHISAIVVNPLDSNNLIVGTV